MQDAPEDAATLENMRIAFETARNAHGRYLQYAGKAESEGWKGVASLFRTAARSAEIHAAHQGRMVHLLGSVPAEPEHEVDIQTTRENLSATLAAQLFGTDIVYPAFIEQARASRDVAAVRIFLWVLTAEKAHERLINEALALVEIQDLDSWVTMPREFQVCPVCGFTCEDHECGDLCPACQCARKRFEVVR